MAEATMTRRPIGVIATLAFSRLVVPLAADGWTVAGGDPSDRHPAPY
jgi:hypothetical protein